MSSHCHRCHFVWLSLDDVDKKAVVRCLRLTLHNMAKSEAIYELYCPEGSTYLQFAWERLSAIGLCNTDYTYIAVGYTCSYMSRIHNFDLRKAKPKLSTTTGTIRIECLGACLPTFPSHNVPQCFTMPTDIAAGGPVSQSPSPPLYFYIYTYMVPEPSLGLCKVLLKPI